MNNIYSDPLNNVVSEAMRVGTKSYHKPKSPFGKMVMDEFVKKNLKLKSLAELNKAWKVWAKGPGKKKLIDLTRKLIGGVDEPVYIVATWEKAKFHKGEWPQDPPSLGEYDFVVEIGVTGQFSGSKSDFALSKKLGGMWNSPVIGDKEASTVFGNFRKKAENIEVRDNVSVFIDEA